MLEGQDDQSCLVPGISESFQKRYFYYINKLSPITLLLSIWCFVSNAAVIIALLRSGIKSIRPGLLMLCSLSFTDLFRSAVVSLTICVFRLKHLLNSQVCQVYSEMETMPLLSASVINFICTILNLTIISIDRYLAVKSFSQYKFLVTWHRALVACAAVWVLSITAGIVRELSGKESMLTNVLLPAISIPSAAVITILQIMTIRLLRRHNRDLAGMMEESNEANPVDTVNAAIERRLSKITTYVVGVLALIFIPFGVTNFITVVSKTNYTELLRPVLTPLFILWSIINPVLYYRGNENVKQGVLGLVKLVKCKQEVVS